MGDITWIKLTTTMFEDEKIKLIEAMPDHDAILIIWIKLLTLAGRSNAQGYLLLNSKIPYSDEMLATIFNRPLSTVRMALEIFKKFEMIEIYENTIFICNWHKHQNFEKMDLIREQNRQRVARHRQKQKLLMQNLDDKKNEITENKHYIVTQSNVTVTQNVMQSNAIEVDIEVDTEVDIDKDSSSSKVDLKEKPLLLSSQEIPEQVYQENIGLITPHISERIGHLIDDGLSNDLICKYIKIAVERNKKNWAYVEKMALGNLEYSVKTVEQYEAMMRERKNTKYKSKDTQQYANFQQREYDANELEKYYVDVSS